MRIVRMLEKYAAAADELEGVNAGCRPSDHGLSPEIREVLRCIHSDPFDAKLSVKTLKSRCGIRDNNVSCRFRCEMGVTIKLYIERQRMEAARQLLVLEHGLGIAEIAQLVGYDHLQTFYRCFRRRFGCTPAIYRVERGRRMETNQ